MKHVYARLAALVLAVLATHVVLVGPAQADDDVERRGSCGHGASWKIKAKPDDGRIEVEAEIESRRGGQRWSWVLSHNGTFSARGSSRTSSRSGSFEVERLTVDAPGTDTFLFRATRRGVVCVATLGI